MNKKGVGVRWLRGERPLIALLLGLVGLGLGGCHRADVGELAEKPISPADKFLDVAYAEGDTFVVVGYRGKVLRSTDAGKTWQEVVPRPTDWTLTDVEFEGEYGWAVGQGGAILHSRDSGKTWSLQSSDTDVHLMSVSFIDKLHGWVSGDLSTVASTDNGGETWNVQRIDVSQVGLNPDMALAIPDLIYYDVFFLDEQNGWLVGEYGNIRHTTDGGKTWDSQHQSLLDLLIFRDVMSLPPLARIRFWDSQRGLIVGASGDILGTEDGGQTWGFIAKEGKRGVMTLKKGTPELAENVPPLHLYNLVGSTENGRVVVVGAGGVVMHSSDHETWEASKFPIDIYTWINGIDINEEGKGVLVGGKGLLLRTEDGGQTWLETEQAGA